jgi:hypothetical protein
MEEGLSGEIWTTDVPISEAVASDEELAHISIGYRNQRCGRDLTPKLNIVARGVKHTKENMRECCTDRYDRAIGKGWEGCMVV